MKAEVLSFLWKLFPSNLDHSWRFYSKLKKIVILDIWQSLNIPYFNYPKIIMNFWKSKRFTFPLHILWLKCRTFIIFWLKQSTSLNGPFKYCEHGSKVYSKIFGVSCKNRFDSQNKGSANMKLSNLVETSFFKWNCETFFPESPELFLFPLPRCSRYLTGPLRLILCVSKQITSVWHSNQKICQEKFLKISFWKIKSQNEIWTRWRSPYFGSQNDFYKSLQKVC